MAFTVNDAADLVRLLAEHPEWRAELRPLILGDEFLAVPARIAAIDERIAAIEVRIAAIDERLTRLEVRVEEAFAATDAKIAVLTDAVNKLVSATSDLTSRLKFLEGRMGHMYGVQLEDRYVRHARDWLKPYIKRARIVFVDELDQIDERNLTEREYDRIIHTDMLAVGAAQDAPGELVIAGEVSAAIRANDVSRAEASAEVLRKSGYRARSLVVGHEIDSDAETLAERFSTIIDLRRAKGAD